MSMNILICGVGGQGTVLAAKVVSQAALSRKEKVLSAETIGMAQRGGSVVSHVRIGSGVYSPLISCGQADVIIAFEATEAVRNIRYLKKNGTVIVNSKIVAPVTASLGAKTFETSAMVEYLKSTGAKVICVDTDEACKKLGSSKPVNMILLGAACSAGIFCAQEIKDAVKVLVKPAFHEINLRAIDYGNLTLV